MKVVLTNVRGRFLNVFTPQAQEGNPPKYSGKFIIDPSDEALVKKIDGAIISVAQEHWKAKADAVMANFVRTGKKPDVCFVKEPYKNKDGEPWAGFEGMYYLSASRDPADGAPLAVDCNPKVHLSDNGRLFDGCVINASVDIWPQDNKWGRAVRATLLGVQFVKTGPGFGSAPASDGSEFGDVAETEADFV